MTDMLPGRVRQTARDVKTTDRLYNLYKKSLLFAAPHLLDSYLLYVEFDRAPQKKFYLPRRKVLRTVVQDMQDLMDGKLDFLAVSLPPRVGKSTLGIFFLTWVMGKFPDLANVMSGHSDKLTKGFYKEVLSIIGDPGYLWRNVFSGHTIHTSAEDESIDLDKKRRYPTLTCRSISGTLTGAVEVGKLLYVDDVIEDLEEALNPLRLQNKYDAYLNQLKDRKKEGAIELHIGTRWAPGDVIGRIHEQYEDNPRYRFRVIPALDENEQSNFNYPYMLGFSTAYYLDMRDSIDRATWHSKYLGEPYIREGLLFPEDELRRYFSLPEGEPDSVLAICDTKDKGTDYAFLPIAYGYGGDFYIEACICDNGLPEIIEPRIVSALVTHSVKMCRFESNSAGGRVAKDVAKAVKEKSGVTQITTRFTTANKETKIIINSGWVKEHCLFKDPSMYKPHTDYGRMMKFLGTYTMSGKNPNDDVPDGMAMLAEFVQSLKSGKVEPIKRPW